ncbi:MAG: hypothetical protein U0800_07880 [Isosphaeraceae bacterium]
MDVAVAPGIGGQVEPARCESLAPDLELARDGDPLAIDVQFALELAHAPGPGFIAGWAARSGLSYGRHRPSGLIRAAPAFIPVGPGIFWEREPPQHTGALFAHGGALARFQATLKPSASYPAILKFGPDLP